MTDLQGVFFIVGPTATGKSEIAADVARELGAEIVSADAFQIYRGLDLLTAKPDAATLAKAPHHLVGKISILEEMNAEKFRGLALEAIAEIQSRRKLAIVVGGRVIRALEICLLSRRPASAQRVQWKSVEAAALGGKSRNAAETAATTGLFVFRDRDELYERINRRVETMFDRGVIEEVRAAGAISETASKMIGLCEIRDLLDGKMSILSGRRGDTDSFRGEQCVAAIQQATRRYAKRQLTWFRRQTNFQPLNLSLLSHNEAVKWISQRARLARAPGND